jgi:hypothetical protein
MVHSLFKHSDRSPPIEPQAQAFDALVIHLKKSKGFFHLMTNRIRRLIGSKEKIHHLAISQTSLLHPRNQRWHVAIAKPNSQTSPICNPGGSTPEPPQHRR